MIVCYRSTYLLVIRISNIKNVKFSHVHPLRLWLCSRLIITAKLVHYKGQTTLKHPPLFFPIILFFSIPSLLGIRNSDIKNAEISHGNPLRTWLCNRLSLTAMPVHFQGQTSPKECIHPILQMIVCYSSPWFLVIQITTIKMLKFLSNVF